ncbi:MAG: O-antigen ligase family protein [Candidatus Falkowbacteria bacterium]
MLNKIIKYLLYFLVFLLPLQTRWIIRQGITEYKMISLYLTDIALIFLLVLFAISKFKIQNYNFNQNSKFKIQNLFLFIAGLDLMIFISIFFASDKLIAIQYYLRFLLGVGLFWLITCANYNKIKLIYFFLAGIFLQACLGIWQFLTQSTFSNKWLGIAEHNAGDLGVSVIETISGERWLRAYGGLDHPNVFGGVLVIGILLLVVKLFCYSKNKLLITHYSLLITFLSALFFTFSRSSWLALIAGIITMLVIAIIKKDLFAQKKILQIILISGILFFILFNLFSDLVLTRISNNTRLENKSNIERLSSYSESLDVIKDNWIFGVGAGNYVSGIMNNELRIKDGRLNNYKQPVHNVFLLIFAEIGVFGLLFFILIPLFIIHNSLFKGDFNIKISLLLALSVISIFDHWFWSLHFGILLFWFVLVLILKIDED